MKYDINKYIERNIDKHYIEMREDLRREYRRIDSFYLKKNFKSKDEEEQVMNFRKYLGGFLDFLDSGLEDIPSDIGINGLRIFHSMLNSYVDRGDLNKTALKVFD